jgi:thioredoxin reductase (NADPH)
MPDEKISFANETAQSGPTVRIFGAPGCRTSFQVRDFLQRSAIKFESTDLQTDEEARRLPGIASLQDERLPVCELPNGVRLYAPTVREVAEGLGFLAKPKLQEYDVSIYGAGPAGLSAAVYAASEGLKAVVIERSAVGGQGGSSSRIENYLGFPDGISGAELAERARQQAVKFGCEILQFREGITAQFKDGKIHVDLADGSHLVARANICATGVEYRRLGLPNEGRFVGAGLFYGAGYSEAARLKGETVYIVGGANSAGQAAMHFSKYAKRVVMLVRRQLSGTMSEYLISRVQNTPNVELQFGSHVVAADGDDVLRQIGIKKADTDAIEIVDAKYLFVCIGGYPHTEWARDTPILRDRNGFIITGTDMYEDGRPPAIWPLERPPYFLETSVPGSFAAGDVRHNSVKRYATAVGEGAMAVTFVHSFLMSDGK